MKKVIKNTPTKLPFTATLFYLFLLHYFDASGLVWGIVLTVFFFIWAALIIEKLKEEGITIDKTDSK